LFINQVHVGQIYSCYFSGTRTGEFNTAHYVLLLRKGFDRQTVTIVPLTSSDRGLNESCCDIGVYPDLNTDGTTQISYAVFSHIQTVSVTRLTLPKGKVITVTSDILETIVKHTILYLIDKLPTTSIDNIATEITKKNHPENIQDAQNSA